MQPASLNFKENATRALADPQLQRALGNVKSGFMVKRAQARAALPEFDELRNAAADIKNHVLAHLDIYLEEYERQVVDSGGYVHWASDAADARKIVIRLCREAGAKTVTKGKSMVSEEIGLNAALEEAGIEPVETDLGEYIIQLRHETPSHIVAPALHLNREQIEGDFRAAHKSLPPDRDLTQIPELVGEARTMLRQKFLAADVGITGANFLIAETGSSVIVTNEGNGDLTQLLPRTHIVIASIEKVVPTLEDASTLLRLLARSATGQEITAYTTFSTGPRREGDPDGPGAYHVVLLDNGRSEMLGTVFRDMLRCIRCGACINHCPVYAAIGGHAYGFSLSRPHGRGADAAADRHSRGRASAECFELLRPVPVRLPDEHSAAQADAALARARLSGRNRRCPFRNSLCVPGPSPPNGRGFTGLLAGIGTRLLSLLAGRQRSFRYLLLAGAWTKHRDLAAPAPRSFQSLWQAAGAEEGAGEVALWLTVSGKVPGMRCCGGCATGLGCAAMSRDGAGWCNRGCEIRNRTSFRSAPGGQGANSSSFFKPCWRSRGQR